ncbi:diacylglycerol/lipid kinase family protein [Palleronia marisminoris]|uniref:diacylglycerol/lipid kinase family protein n=1 Tax=Palleronia marisminoris TaxID=315423 RepID=UPI0023EA533D|nr:diacylglycerol kinase family protein [Palleronia marisminoris]
MLLHNPSAGMGEHSREELSACLAAEGMSVTYCSTSSDDIGECLAQRADLIIIAGGDGTVCRAVAHLSERRRPFGIIPLGGSNNVATSLGFEHRTILSGDWPGTRTPRPLHVGRIRTSAGDRNFLEGVGFGALPLAIGHKNGSPRTIEEKIQNGRQQLASELSDLEPGEVRMVVDGQTIEGTWLMAEVLTMTHTGPRLPLAPTAGALQARFTVVLLGEARRDEMLEWLKSPEDKPPPVQVLSAREVLFQPTRPTLFRIDDSVEQVHRQGLDLRIDDEPLHVILPSAHKDEVTGHA